MAMLGGSYFELPKTGVLDVLSRFTFNRYALEAYRAIINRGATLTSPEVALNFAVLVGVAAAMMAIAVPAFKVRRD
jgi:ABC-type multidrug transport system permease subunit